MKISLASDHAGFPLKELIKNRLNASGHDVTDRGCFNETSVDYPDYGVSAAQDVAAGKVDRAILVCGSGIGMSIVANKVRGVRAALCCSVLMAELSRLHNDANVLCLGARYTEPDLAQEIVEVWLKTPFEGGRHQRRVEKINKLDEG